MFKQCDFTVLVLKLLKVPKSSNSFRSTGKAIKGLVIWSMRSSVNKLILYCLPTISTLCIELIKRRAVAKCPIAKIY